MLNHFPKPYPGEWWYSVLCRYYLSTGIKESALVKEELFKSRTAMMAPLFPNGTLQQVIKRLPPDTFDFDEILEANTLYRYYMRFFPKAEQESIHRSLSKGGSPKLTHMRVNYGRKNFAPRYCPICMKEDAKAFGEPYYHVEHQIPMVTVCSKHGEKLQQISLDEKSSFISSFRPLSLEKDIKVQGYGTKSELRIAQMATEFLQRPLSIGPTEGYNNLITSLINHGYYRFDRASGLAIDSDLLLQSLKRLYGDELVYQVFGERIGHGVMLKIRRFAQIMPDRYVLLLGAALLNFDAFLVNGPIEDYMLTELEKVRKSKKTLTIADVANKMELQECEVRALCKYHGIEPFWMEKDNYVRSGVVKKRIICTVTEEEYERLQRAAREHGYGSPGEYLVHMAIKNRYS